MSNPRFVRQHIPTPPPLPVTVEDLQAQRIGTFEFNLNDAVDDIHVILWATDPAYVKFLYAIHDSQAVEGSLSADNWFAAMRIREYAAKKEIKEVADENLSTIGRAMNVVLRRFNLSRKQRRNMVHGEVVPDDGNE